MIPKQRGKHNHKQSERQQPPEGSPSECHLVVAIGNPGAAYARTYHNAGLLALTYLTKHRATKPKKRVVAALFSAEVYARKILIKTKVFMNESGKAAREIIKKFPGPTEKLLILHDDSDIQIGEVKFSFGRGAAGHHGVASLIKELGTKNFWRCRIGTRATPGKAGKFALKTITPENMRALHLAFGKITEKLIEKDTP